MRPGNRAMIRVVLSALVAFAVSVVAAPGLPAFDRFHSGTPTAESGRLLYNELGCANCHGGDTGLPGRSALSLTNITSRIRGEWLISFLSDPAGARSGTTMPGQLHGRDPAAARAVVHYLASLADKTPARRSPARHVNAQRGGELYHAIGCVACHVPDPGAAGVQSNPPGNDIPSVLFPDLASKFSLSSLAAFLLDPLKTRPDGRMPRFELEAQDATDIAGYLIGFQGSDGTLDRPIVPLSIDEALVPVGKRIVAGLRCAACHDLPGREALEPVPLRDLRSGCLLSEAQPGVPRYSLAPAQRVALEKYLGEPHTQLPVATRARLTLQALNCLACHERAGLGGPDAALDRYFQGDVELGDVGRHPPPLTAVGRKLKPDWLTDVLAGKARVRPYLRTRMPVFGTATDGLTDLLAEADRRPEQALPAGDPDAGRRLMGVTGGLGCITCHRWKGEASIGIQALDLETMDRRLQAVWLHEYLVDPAAYRPGTLMPSFWPDGKASNPEILGGDTALQIASLYAFVREGTGRPEGLPGANQQFELRPTDRPIVQRTFMEGAGTAAILVGFPEGVHLAYDARQARPALAWKGRFFDAYRTWFSRFPIFEKPPGDSLVSWPSATDPASTGASGRYLGYRIDSRGVPVFLSLVRGSRVEDRFEGLKTGLRRVVQWDMRVLDSIGIVHPTRVDVTEIPNRESGRMEFIYTWK
jgi:mono/diheme cytochrome c family protein